MSNAAKTTYIAKCPKTGLTLRAATAAEQAAYESQPTKAPFDKPVLVDGLLIDNASGPGAWFGGAGF